MHASDAVFYASFEIDGGGIGKVLGGATHLSHRVSEPDNLCQPLVVEYKVVGVLLERQLLEKFP